MALKKVNTTFKQLKKGDKVEGYLLTVGVQSFAPKVPGGAPTEVPTLTLQDEKGDRFKVILGSTVKDDVNLLAVHVWTQICKSKEERTTRSGMNVIEYDLLQDVDRQLRG